MDRIGELVTFWDRVAEKAFDPNGNGRLDADEAIGAVKKQVNRIVADYQASPASHPAADFSLFDQCTPSELKQFFARARVELEPAYAHGVEMPSDAQLQDLSLFVRDAGRRMHAFKERGTFIDRAGGTADVIADHLHGKLEFASAVLDTALEGSGVGAKGKRSPDSKARGARD